LSDNTYYGFNLYGNNAYQEFSTGVSIKDNQTNTFTSANKDNPAIIIGSRNSTIITGITNSVIIGGSSIVANQSNTVYVSKLNINSITTGTSINNLGIDVNGNVISTSGTSVVTPYDISFAISDEITQIITGTSVTTLFAPRTFDVNEIKFSLSVSGSTTSTIDVFKNGSTILTAPLSLSASVTGVTISPNTITENDKITVDITAAGTGAQGAKIYLKGQL
jgi:hypothetical protein